MSLCADKKVGAQVHPAFGVAFDAMFGAKCCVTTAIVPFFTLGKEEGNWFPLSSTMASKIAPDLVSFAPFVASKFASGFASNRASRSNSCYASSFASIITSFVSSSLASHFASSFASFFLLFFFLCFFHICFHYNDVCFFWFFFEVCFRPCF